MVIKEELKVSEKLMSQEKYKEAENVLEVVLNSYPNNLWAIHSLLKVKIKLNEYQSIVPFILKRTSFKKKHPSDPEFIKLIAELVDRLRHHIYIQSELKYIMELVNNSFNEWHKSIANFNNSHNDVKVAVLISGQIRGYENSLPSIKSFLEGVDSEIFISVWDRLGFRDITTDKRSYKHLDRTFDKNFCDIVNSKGVDLTGYLNAARNLRNHLTPKFNDNILGSYFSDYKLKVLNEREFEKTYRELEKKLISFHPDSEVVFADSINMLKMSYSNYIGLSMAKESDYDYTHILKLRPDFIINNKYTLKDLIDSEVMGEFSFIDSWGGTIGDQFYFGPWKDGSHYNSLWEFWLKMKEPIMEIGSLLKPHKRLYDYLKYGDVSYIYLPNISKGFDSSSKISTYEHIKLVSTDFEYFKNNATDEQFHLFNEYLRKFSP